MKSPQKLIGSAVLAILVGWLAAPMQAAAVDYFLQIEGVQGESADDKHKEWIEILSYSWGAESAVDPLSGAAKFVSGNFEISKTMDKSSPKLAEACATGAHYTKAILTLRKSGGDRQIEFVRYVFADILITGYSVNHSGDETRPMESISMNFAKVGVEYFTILPLGTIGGRDAFLWDFILNGAATLTFPSSIDSDGDGMMDDWERAFGLDPTIADDTVDKDGDGASNKDEYIAGTDPAAADKVFKATLDFTPGARNATLNFSSAPDRNYRVLISPGLDQPFQPFMTIPSSGQGTTSIQIPAGTINQFFRVEVVP